MLSANYQFSNDGAAGHFKATTEYSQHCKKGHAPAQQDVTI